MSIVRTCALVAAAALGLALAASGADAQKKGGKCVMAAGEGTGAGETIAKVMADAALKSSISKAGGSPSGAVVHKCSTQLLLTTCTASQRVCK